MLTAQVSLLEQIISSGRIECDDGTFENVHSAIPRDEGLYLQSLIREHRPSTSLEIGCAFGISSLYMCEALKEVGLPSISLSILSRTARPGKVLGWQIFAGQDTVT